MKNKHIVVLIEAIILAIVGMILGDVFGVALSEKISSYTYIKEAVIKISLLDM